MRRRLSVIVLLLALVGSSFTALRSAVAQDQVYTDSMDSAFTGYLSTESFDWSMLVPGKAPYATGTATSFSVEPGASSVIEVLVQGPTATIAVNGALLPQFDISTILGRGNVYRGAGNFIGNAIDDRVISDSNWWIYPTDLLDIPSG
jgi:hypothetical protein